MKDLKFEQSHPLSRNEAADLLTELAEAMRKGEEAELSLITGVLSLRIPDELWGEVEWEVGDGKIELEIEFTWPMGATREATASAPAAASPEKPARSRKSAPAKRTRTKRTAAAAKKA